MSLIWSLRFEAPQLQFVDTDDAQARDGVVKVAMLDLEFDDAARDRLGVQGGHAIHRSDRRLAIAEAS